ncbi:ATP-dependent zinc protease family protein [Vibrio rumoiensis]|nr:RimK/LysX family protein [Vibrio rumoiensis]
MKTITALLSLSLLMPMAAIAADDGSAAATNNCDELGSKIVLGQKEWVTVVSSKQRTIARVDTGATTSSINAADIKTYQKDGKDMVDFKIKTKDAESDVVTLPVKRWVHIKQSSTLTASKRPIVSFDIQIGQKTYTTDFDLVDRSHMLDSILLGRSFLTHVAVVDVEQQYIQK